MHYVDIRKQVFEKYPEIRAIHRRTHPEQLLIGLFWLIAIVTVSAWLARAPFSPLLFVACAFVLGMAYAALGFFNHELMHGTMVRSKQWRMALSYPGFFIFAISPELWETWHNILHHYYPNCPGIDPDNNSYSVEHYHSLKFGKAFSKYFPYSRHPVSVMFLLSAFTVQSFNVFWMRSRVEKGHAGYYDKMSRRRATIETFAYYALWLGAALALGPVKFAFLLVIPAMVANYFVVSYVGVLHTTRPMTAGNEPLETTLSVRSSRLRDVLFFHFGLHNEHHVFPECNHRYYPLVQKALKTEFPEDYCQLDHGNAMAIAFSTPRIYRGMNHLYDPETGRMFDLVGLKRSGFRRTFFDAKEAR